MKKTITVESIIKVAITVGILLAVAYNLVYNTPAHMLDIPDYMIGK